MTASDQAQAHGLPPLSLSPGVQSIFSGCPAQQDRGRLSELALNFYVLFQWLYLRLLSHAQRPQVSSGLSPCSLATSSWLGAALWLALAGTGLAQTSLPFPAKTPALSSLSEVLSSAGGKGPVVTTEQVRAELKLHAPQGIQAGQTFWLGLHLQHQPDWHTYWQNPGDSGLATQLKFQLPAGWQTGDIVWPLPRKFPIGTLANYGYEGSLLLRVPVTVASDFQWPANQALPVQLQADWLVCRKECIPQEGQFSLNLTSAAPQSQHAALFDAAQKQSPRRVDPSDAAGQGETSVSDNGRQLTLRLSGLPAAWRGKTLTAFPVTAAVVHNAAVQGQDWTQNWNGSVWSAQWPVSAERGESPERMRWVIAQGAESAPQAPALELETPVLGQWPALTAAAPAEISPALAKALAENAQAANRPAASTTSMGLALAILGALLGGLLLNLMPCVFPVLAIKVLGFAQPGSNAARHRAAGAAYTVGVVLSFMLLGGLMLAMRAAGEQLGWGFQLQSPLVVAGLALLFTLIGLNLAGVFELGQILPSGLASLQSRHPTVDAGLSGVLAVAIASPCTAPFMGASLGLAIALPTWQALTVFAAMGLGMALPYLAASWWPGLARALPRPGAWMVTFRQAMAFPMWATVIWLVWVLGQQTGIDGASALLALLLTSAWLAWALGLKGRTRWVMSGLALATLFWLGSNWLPLALREAPATSTTSSASGPNASSQGLWQAWSVVEMQAHLNAGRPVFVDFTAAWCVTCQYNKKTTLADPQVLADFASRQVVLMRADWTRRDPAITQALTALGRSGVPVYALYVPNQPPILLSELPSVSEVHAALQQLQGAK